MAICVDQVTGEVNHWLPKNVKITAFELYRENVGDPYSAIVLVEDYRSTSSKKYAKFTVYPLVLENLKKEDLIKILLSRARSVEFKNA